MSCGRRSPRCARSSSCSRGRPARIPSARLEFLESSAGQLDRLDWLAQNLLELSKLDSGLVLLDLRPDDLRGDGRVCRRAAAGGRRAQGDRPDGDRARSTPALPARSAARRTGRHEPRGQRPQVHTSRRRGPRRRPGRGRRRGPHRGGRHRRSGSQTRELPHIFDRFYRGAQSSEARSAGSGLGLSIVKSIVDMHHGTIAVESRVGHGSRFVVTLPRDPREVTDVEPAQPDAEGAAWAAPAVHATKVDDSSPSAASIVNPDTAPLSSQPEPEDAGEPIARERSSAPR